MFSPTPDGRSNAIVYMSVVVTGYVHAPGTYRVLKVVCLAVVSCSGSSLLSSFAGSVIPTSTLVLLASTDSPPSVLRPNDYTDPPFASKVRLV